MRTHAPRVELVFSPSPRGAGRNHVTQVALLLLCAAAIYFSCEWFVNAVEWLGHKLNVGSTVVGTVLAAVGTALPESVVTFVAVALGHGARQQDIGVGAAMGGPLVLATVAYGVVGWTLLASRGPGWRRAYGDTAGLARDQMWFMAVFAVKVTLGLVAFSWKPWLGLLFFAAYGVYFWRVVRGRGGDAEHGPTPAPLRLQRRRAIPATWAVLVQTLAALAVIFVASQLFVGALGNIGAALGLPAAVTALLLAPLATELPEIMNAVIWVRQGKTRLALANVSGAMMIQATIPSGLGLLFTPWRFDTALFASGVCTMVAIAYLFVTLRTSRLTMGNLSLAIGFYGLFAVALIPALA
jgi:cation:H+ antiporter